MREEIRKKYNLIRFGTLRTDESRHKQRALFSVGSGTCMEPFRILTAPCFEAKRRVTCVALVRMPRLALVERRGRYINSQAFFNPASPIVPPAPRCPGALGPQPGHGAGPVVRRSGADIGDVYHQRLGRVGSDRALGVQAPVGSSAGTDRRADVT